MRFNRCTKPFATDPVELSSVVRPGKTCVHGAASGRVRNQLRDPGFVQKGLKCVVPALKTMMCKSDRGYLVWWPQAAARAVTSNHCVLKPFWLKCSSHFGLSAPRAHACGEVGAASMTRPPQAQARVTCWHTQPPTPIWARILNRTRADATVSDGHSP